VEAADLETGRATRMTIRDIAAHLGVSIATVSRVINGRPDVSPRTREAVLAYVREQGYSTNRIARGLAGGRSGLVGLSLPYVHSAYFGEIAAGASEALAEREARLILSLTEHQHDREVTLLDRLMHNTTDGALLVLPSETNAELLAVRDQGYPFVVIDPMKPMDPSLPVVMSSHWHTGRVATEHLIMLGHRRIGVISGPADWVASLDRLAGFMMAMAAAGLPVQSNLIQYGDFESGSACRLAGELLDSTDPPTAIFAFNDNMAAGVMRAARDRGLRVPEDLSVVGVDDVEVTAYMTPSLTTVRQPLREMARVASVLLWRLIEGETVEAMRMELSTRLVVRESTAPPSR